MPLDIINNATSSLTGGVQSAFSSASSLADKVNFNNIKDIANQGIDKISNAAKGLIARPTAQIETKIPTNALPKIGASTKDTAPPPSKPKLPPSTLTYPVDMKYYTTFKFLKYRRILATDKPTEAYTAVIVLPMPSNLNESHSLDYETANLGALLGAGTEFATSSIRNFQDVPGVRDREEASAKGLLAGAAVAIGTSMFGKKEALAAAARRATGLTPNPYQAVVFQNVNLRSHSFTYRFAPNSFEELQTVKKIIK